MKYDASMSFRFTDGSNVIYNYNGKTSEVTGPGVSDSIKYAPSRVNNNLAHGTWKVLLEDTGEFPRGGVFANLQYSKVFVVGKATTGNLWVIETGSGHLTRVQGSELKRISDIDEQVFAMSADLGIPYQQALKMINKGYGKV
ncbi:hypothetical protein D3C80_1107050 [compost metagenome]